MKPALKSPHGPPGSSSADLPASLPCLQTEDTDEKARAPCPRWSPDHCCAGVSRFLSVLVFVSLTEQPFSQMNPSPCWVPLLVLLTCPVLDSTVCVMEPLFLKCMAILRWKVGRDLYNTFFFFNLLGTNPQTRICVCLHILVFIIGLPLFQPTPFHI